jgi:hypothetical protein
MTTIEDPHPLRFRSPEEFIRYQVGEIPMSRLPQPGTKEYDEAPFQLIVFVGQKTFSKV